MTLSEIRRAIDALKRKFATQNSPWVIKTDEKSAAIAEAVVTNGLGSRPDGGADPVNRTTSSSASSRPAALPPHLRDTTGNAGSHRRTAYLNNGPTPGRRPRTLRHGRQPAPLD